MLKETIAGPLNSVSRLTETYSKIFEQSDSHELFCDVRIAVFGRSGAGKTTLIRLIFGDDGPQIISEGTRGEQDIDKEWRCPDPEIPIIIHDSNGVDIRGPERVETIRNFLDKHQKNTSFSKKIHLVWYVISAVDSRIRDDGGVMQLISEYDIPLLLIMTHNDMGENIAKKNVSDRILDNLLSSVRYKERVKEQMVKVSNDVSLIESSNRLIQENVNKAALKLVQERTKELLHKKLKYTWVSAQAIDMDAKLDASASLIVSYKKKALCSCVVAAIPVAQQVKLGTMLVDILKGLCMIWGVPVNLQKSLYKDIATPDATRSFLKDMFWNMLRATGLTAAVALTVATSGLCLPLVVGIMTSSSIADAKFIPVVLMNYSCLILGSILYVKSIQSATDKWDADKSQDEYTVLCNEFATSDFKIRFKNSMLASHSRWETIMQTKKQQKVIKTHILNLFREFMKKRPNGLFTLMKNDQVEPLPEYQQQHTNVNHAPAKNGTAETSALGINVDIQAYYEDNDPCITQDSMEI